MWILGHIFRGCIVSIGVNYLVCVFLLCATYLMYLEQRLATHGQVSAIVYRSPTTTFRSVGNILWLYSPSILSCSRVQPYTMTYVCGQAWVYVPLYCIRFSVIIFVSLTRLHEFYPNRLRTTPSIGNEQLALQFYLQTSTMPPKQDTQGQLVLSSIHSGIDNLWSALGRVTPSPTWGTSVLPDNVNHNEDDHD